MASDNPQAPDEETVFDAVLTPHRSLGPRGFRILLLVVGTVSTLFSIPFYIMGAWPVIGFFGLDVALLYVFFRLNYRDALRQERVLLTHVRLLFSRSDARGVRREWLFNPLWVRLQRDEIEEFGITRLALVQRGRAVEIARCLGAMEKASFADAFARALAVARRGPDYERAP
ncbi:DUF2244 domain-containing protein [Labrys wisconsinensis]|uniref:Membrane protein n=1 Tax=Labrys wisconsinensis TaxID=425677 RepID=A0ABU0IZA2_9HYPH|nr:DUF2244 domain-containing protein [Labrys wisconsinensis]MDQ0467345.1 putative membrane protein [Labrys wisconsinensis]